MPNKLEVIKETADLLLTDYPDGWTGDVHEFATASAYTTKDDRLWLTSGDARTLHEEAKEEAFVSEYALISASFKNGERQITIQRKV
jgi:hypothetical protein